MKRIQVLLENLQSIENQLIENEIIEDGSIATDIIGDIKEKLHREINNYSLKTFHVKLWDLIDKYPNVSSLRGVINNIENIEIALLDELNKE